MTSLILALLLPALAHGQEVRPIVAADLGPGLGAEAELGDVLLWARRGGRFVVSALDHRVGMQATGGNLIDVWLEGTEDAFDGMTPWFDRDYPRQAAWTALEILPDGVRITGADTHDPQLHVEQRLHLIDDPRVAGHLLIATTVTNHSADPRPAHDLGDIVGWGGLQHFAPGPGFALAGRDETLPWLGAEGDEYALALVAGAPLTGPHGASWSDPVYEVVDLAAGASVTYERHLLVGRTLAELAGSADTLRGLHTLGAMVLARDASTGAPVAGARMVVEGEGGVALAGRTGKDGRLALSLPAGSYGVKGEAPGRRLHREGMLTVPSRGVVPVDLSPAGRVRLVATDARNRPMPARFTFRGLDGPDPVLGSPSRAIGGNRVHLASPEQVAMPPGRYLVTVSRGPAWSVETREFDVSPASPGDVAPELRVSLRRLVAKDGWLQCDLHTHAAPSFDSAIPLEDGLIAAAAEGVDCIATTDHDAAVDWGEALESTGLLGHLLWLPGLEITSEEGAGHINTFPWSPDLGSWDHRGQTAQQIVDGVRQAAPGAVVQLNHPLWGAIGLWSRVGIDPSTGRPLTRDADGKPTGATTDFDAVEVANGKGVDGFGAVLDAWETMLDAGVRTVAVGNSDSHRIVGQERGSMRTWVHVGGDRSAAAVVRALRGHGEVVASNAPLVRVQAEPGDPTTLHITVWAAWWVPLDSVELHAGDPTRLGSWVPRRWQRGDPEIRETLEDGQRRWTIDLTLSREATDGWVLALARGDTDMEPWLDVPAWGISNPLFLGD